MCLNICVILEPSNFWGVGREWHKIIGLRHLIRFHKELSQPEIKFVMEDEPPRSHRLHLSCDIMRFRSGQVIGLL